jgi:hypothetical protein
MKVNPVLSFIFRSKIKIEEIVELLAEDNGGEKSPSMSSPQQSPIKVKGNHSRKLDFPPDYQKPFTSLTVASSKSDDNENNNNTSADSISDNSDSELFSGDVSGSEYMGAISESETSDYTSEDESLPPPRKVVKKENQNQEVKQQPRKRHKQKRSAIVSRAGGDSNNRTGRAETLHYVVKCNWKKNLRTFEYIAAERVQKPG